METKDKYTAVDFITYQSGVNVGYSLASLTENPEILEVIKSPELRKRQHPFLKGIWQGYDKGMLDRDFTKQNQRMDELSKTKGNCRDQEIER